MPKLPGTAAASPACRRAPSTTPAVWLCPPAQRVLGQIVLPEVAANMTFGGSDLKTLYIMGSTSVYRLPVLVAGEKAMYSK